MGFFHNDGVVMSVDGRIDAHAENVLVILGQHPATNDVAVLAGLAWIDIDDIENTRCTRLDGDGAGLVKLIGEDVLVISKCDDELHHELATARNDSPAGAPIAVLPADTIVLLVQTDSVRQFRCATVGLCEQGVEVLDHPETVAADGKVIGSVTTTTITKVKGLLAVVRGSRIGVGNRL